MRDRMRPATSSVAVGPVVPMPTLLLLMTMRVTPEVSNASCEVPARWMPEEGSDTKE